MFPLQSGACDLVCIQALAKNFTNKCIMTKCGVLWMIIKSWHESSLGSSKTFPKKKIIFGLRSDKSKDGQGMSGRAREHSRQK